MKPLRTMLFALLALGLLAAPGIAATGPGCTLPILEDWGDAPECIAAYPGGVIGHFPTCAGSCAAGTQELFCLPALSTPPGATGYVRHLAPADENRYWLGCYGHPGAGGGGIDSESDGKVNTPSVGTSACAPGLATDCVEIAYGMSFDQDECPTDAADASLYYGPFVFPACGFVGIPYLTAVCGPNRPAYLNVLVDWNHDGDWNDNVRCGSECAYEWAVKNSPVVLSNDCSLNYTPAFRFGSTPGPAWLRISLTDSPVPDDYPWNGSAGTPLGAFLGGETEDYPLSIDAPTSDLPSTWGHVKGAYR